MRVIGPMRGAVPLDIIYPLTPRPRSRLVSKIVDQKEIMLGGGRARPRVPQLLIFFSVFNSTIHDILFKRSGLSLFLFANFGWLR